MKAALYKIITLLAITWLSLSPTHAQSNYESGITDALSQIKQGDINAPLQSLEQLVEQHPNSKLGHLIIADLLAAKAGNPNLIASLAKENKSLDHQLNGLRDELRYRWLSKTSQTPATQGLIPENLILSAPSEQYILAADAKYSRLYIFENLGSHYNLIADYFMTIGTAGMGKEKQGDKRTPVGVYYINDYIDGKNLPDRYGPGAFPINYPNLIDKRHNRTGYGIWIHGTESENYNRIPLASDGCLSLSNDEFLTIKQYIEIDGSTPIIIANGFNWVQQNARQALSKDAKNIIKQWQQDWEKLDPEQHLTHYSETEFKDYQQFSKRKRQVQTSKTFINIGISNLSIYSYPGEPNLITATFDQSYKSNTYQDITQKLQYWRNIDGKWQIIHESERD